MVESGLLANGSVNGFLDGKHFNRCKRLHRLVALGLEILHFKSFLEMSNTSVRDDMIKELHRLQNCKMSSFDIEHEELKELINNKITVFINNEVSMASMERLNNFILFILISLIIIIITYKLSRSIRFGDFELYKSVLSKITNLFFICNQQNYARWTVKYADNLMKVADIILIYLKDFNGVISVLKGQ